MHGIFSSGHVDNSFTTKTAMGSVETGTSGYLKQCVVAINCHSIVFLYVTKAQGSCPGRGFELTSRLGFRHSDHMAS
jgi:hypothetical protein